MNTERRLTGSIKDSLLGEKNREVSESQDAGSEDALIEIATRNYEQQKQNEKWNIGSDRLYIF